MQKEMLFCESKKEDPVMHSRREGGVALGGIAARALVIALKGT